MSKETLKDLFLSTDSEQSEESDSGNDSKISIPVKRKRKVEHIKKEDKIPPKKNKKLTNNEIEDGETNKISNKLIEKKVKKPTVVELSDFAPFLHLINGDVIGKKKQGKMIALIPIYK